jgi:PEP-CTERM motif
MKKLMFAASVAVLALAQPASAVEIVGLYNSGVNAGGSNSGSAGGAATGNGFDPHWQVCNSATSTSCAMARNGGINGSFPIGPWLSETANSRWLTPTGNASDAVGSFVYRLVFDLTGYDASTALFQARAATDDIGELWLNNAFVQNVGSFSSWTNVNVNSGFNAGLNTLELRVFNTGGGPSGARIEFLESDIESAVPEPATWLTMLLGFGLIGAALRKRSAALRLA